MAKKVFFLLPSLKYGGAEQVAINLAMQFKANNHEVYFLTLTDAGELREKVKKNFNYINLDCKKTYQLPLRLISFFLDQPKDKNSILISSFWKLNLCASICKLFSSKLQLLLWEHSLPSKTTYIPNWLYYLSTSILYRTADAVVCVSTGVYEDVSSLSYRLRNLVIIFNPIAPPDQPLQKIYEDTETHPHSMQSLVWVGRMDEPKNPHLALDAFILLKQTKNVSIKFIGDGPLLDELKARVEDIGLSDVVNFTGFSEHPYAHMLEADLLLLTSKREGLPTVVVEALYCDLKIVSTNCSLGLNDILIDGKFGILSEQDTAQEIALAITKALAISLPPGHQVQGSEPFHPEKIFSQYKNLLEI
jgi:glycosyltransferase involved in cell wall biosynthesis